MPLPTLASFEDEAIRIRRLSEEVEQLKGKLAAMGVQDVDLKSNLHETSRTELMDDFYIIGKRYSIFTNDFFKIYEFILCRETATSAAPTESQTLTLKSFMRNISGGIPTSPILGRKQPSSGIT